MSLTNFPGPVCACDQPVLGSQTKCRLCELEDAARKPKHGGKALSRLHLTMLRRHRVEAAILASRAIPYIRKAARLIERFHAVENGLRTRDAIDRVAALPNLLGAFVNRNLVFGAAK